MTQGIHHNFSLVIQPRVLLVPCDRLRSLDTSSRHWLTNRTKPCTKITLSKIQETKFIRTKIHNLHIQYTYIMHMYRHVKKFLYLPSKRAVEDVVGVVSDERFGTNTFENSSWHERCRVETSEPLYLLQSIFLVYIECCMYDYLWQKSSLSTKTSSIKKKKKIQWLPLTFIYSILAHYRFFFCTAVNVY